MSAKPISHDEFDVGGLDIKDLISKDGCFGKSGPEIDTKTLPSGGCFPGGAEMDITGIVGGAMNSMVGSALGSLLAVTDSTPAAQAVLSTLVSKYKDQLTAIVGDPSESFQKLTSLFIGITSSASVPLGQALPTGGIVVLVGGAPCTRIGDLADMKELLDAGPFIQANPTVILNGMFAVGKGHEAIGLTKATVGEVKLVAATVLMGAATVTDTSFLEKAKVKAGTAAPSGAPPKPPSPEQSKDASDMAYNGKVGDKTPDGKWEITKVSPPDDSGFRAITLEPADGSPEEGKIVAFAGTNQPFSWDGLADWSTNIQQRNGGDVPKQHELADKYLKTEMADGGSPPHTVGHSLGGGLAMYAGSINNTGVTTFNSARLSDNTLADMQSRNPNYDYNKITNYRNIDDVASNTLGGGTLPGTSIIYDSDNDPLSPYNIYGNHGIGGMELGSPKVPANSEPSTLERGAGIFEAYLGDLIKDAKAKIIEEAKNFAKTQVKQALAMFLLPTTKAKPFMPPRPAPAQAKASVAVLAGGSSKVGGSAGGGGANAGTAPASKGGSGGSSGGGGGKSGGGADAAGGQCTAPEPAPAQHPSEGPMCKPGDAPLAPPPAEPEILTCPTEKPNANNLPPGWQPYEGAPSLFHCGFDGIKESRSPSPGSPQNECFYDGNGTLVDENHPYAGCGGSPNSNDSMKEKWDHTFHDPGGIVHAGPRGAATSVGKYATDSWDAITGIFD